jgi:hypothetical protein
MADEGEPAVPDGLGVEGGAARDSDERVGIAQQWLS